MNAGTKLVDAGVIGIMAALVMAALGVGPSLTLFLLALVVLVVGACLASAPVIELSTVERPSKPNEPTMEWRAHKARRAVFCSNCGTEIPTGENYWSRWFYDPERGSWESGADERLCELDAQLHHEAELLGETGIKDEYTHGHISQERMEALVGALESEEQ